MVPRCRACGVMTDLRKHQCLTQGHVLDLLANPLPPSSPALLFSALQSLSQCDRCWIPIKALRNQSPHPSKNNSPFASFFYTLITRRVWRAAHRAALWEVRSSPFGVYRLLLEEIVEHLPANHPADNQQALLLFDLLLEKIRDSSPQWHDLVARTAAVQALLWNHHGDPGRAKEELRRATYHRGRGTGDKELHASILASNGEVLHPNHPGEAMACVRRALHLVSELPLRKLELLFQLAEMHLHWQELGEAWQLFLDAEELADEHAHYLLESVWQRLLDVEVGLVIFGEEHKRTLYFCIGNYHARCLGFTVRGACPPFRPLEPQPTQPGCTVAQAQLESLCLAWSAGHDIRCADWWEMQQLLANSGAAKKSFEALYKQLTDLWVRYPGGRLAQDFLEPLVACLDQMSPPV